VNLCSCHCVLLLSFQGLIRVMRHDDETPPPFDLDALLRPRPYKVRVYMLHGDGLQPQDLNGKSDPYIKVGEPLGRVVSGLTAERQIARRGLKCLHVVSASVGQAQGVRSQACTEANKRSAVLSLF